MNAQNTSPAFEVPADREVGGGYELTVAEQHEPGIAILSMDESWVKVHRKILEHWIYKRPEYVSIWIYLIARANWKPSKALVNGAIVTLERGEVLTSIGSLAENTHTSRQTVRTFLRLAQTDGMICVKSNTGATCVKLLNYDKLQQRENNDQHAINTRLTRDQHAPNNIIRKKEYKKVRKEEDNNVSMYAPTSSEVVANLPQNDGLFFPITKEQYVRWQELYPAVNVKSELSKIIGWLEANPAKRKTARGMLRFVNSWLSREQDKAHMPVLAPQIASRGFQPPNPTVTILPGLPTQIRDLQSKQTATPEEAQHYLELLQQRTQGI